MAVSEARRLRGLEEENRTDCRFGSGSGTPGGWVCPRLFRQRAFPKIGSFGRSDFQSLEVCAAGNSNHWSSEPWNGQRFIAHQQFLSAPNFANADQDCSNIESESEDLFLAELPN